MRTLVIEHQPDAAAGVFGEVLAGRGDLTVWRPAQDATAPDLPAHDAVLVLGGGMHPDQDDRYPWLAAERQLLGQALERDVWTLGVCLGHELLGQQAGGRAVRSATPEIGWFEVELTLQGRSDPVFGALPARFAAFEWHSYRVERPPGAEALAANPAAIQALRLAERAWSVQFHAEVTTEIAAEWIARYARDEDALAAGLDPPRLLEETRSRMPAWNALGRKVAEAFAGAAASGQAG